MKTNIILVIDTSGSMFNLMNSVHDFVFNFFKELKRNAKGGITNFSLYSFNDITKCLIQNINPITQVCPPLFMYSFGNTALFDAVGMTIAQNVVDKKQDYLVIVLTDGEENNSKLYHSSDVKSLMKKHKNLTLAFNVPPGKMERFITEFQIPAGNVREWNPTILGVKETQVHTSSGMANYFTQQAKGKRQVTNFYTDLSNLSTNKIKRDLDDLSDKFKKYKVEAEMPIRGFVEYKTRKTYVIGSTYYLLTKKEKIQKNKNILIQEKGKKEVYGGDDVRHLLNLPEGQDIVLIPGNHANYDIYVQSTSPNRKLVRGTTVLVDLQLNKDLIPTWSK